MLMRTLGIAALFVILLTGGGFVWWKVNYPTYSYRIRMIVAVDVDGETRTGSSVIEIIGQTQPQIGGAPATFFRYREMLYSLISAAAGKLSRRLALARMVAPTFFSALFQHCTT